MATPEHNNPLVQPILDTFKVKRAKKTGLVPRNWLLILLKLLDLLHECDEPLNEDDVYTYDYTLKKSRAGAIPELLKKYEMPVELGLSSEGITVRGAPALRFFRAIHGGSVLAEWSATARQQCVLEAIEIIRTELKRVVSQGAVCLPSHEFDLAGKLVRVLLKALQNRSNGRVEQALVGAKLQLRFPGENIPNNPAFAGDRQTSRECDYEVKNLRVIVSVSPKDAHYSSAMALARQGRSVFLVVSDKSVEAARKTIADEGFGDNVTVTTVAEYVSINMKEIESDLNLSPREMCLKFVQEYNHRIDVEPDKSLKVVLPEVPG